MIGAPDAESVGPEGRFRSVSGRRTLHRARGRASSPDRARSGIPGDEAASSVTGMTDEHLAPTGAGSGSRRDVPEPEPGTDPSARLLATAPGPALAELLETLDPRALDAYAQVEFVAACARVVAWMHVRMAEGAAALAEHPDLRPPEQESPRHRVVTVGDQTATSLAWRLQAPRHEMHALLRAGTAYRGTLAATGRAVASGQIDPRRAQVLVERLHDQPEHVATAVQDLVLPHAPGRTATQVRQDVERALLQVDPDRSAERHQRARAGRRVSRPQVLPDGMAGLWVVLPAADTVQVDTVLEQCARAARAHGDPRTPEQLRADGLRDLVLRPADAGPPRAGTEHLEEGAGTSGYPRASVHVAVTVPLGTLMGQDDAPAELAGYGPIGAPEARDLAADGIWRRIVTDPVSHAVLDVGRTRYRPGAALADHIRQRDRHCSAPGCVVPADRSELDHTIEFHPQPGAPPGSERGTTSAGNLGPLCPPDHALKTAGGFRLRQIEPGLYEWVAPTGHRYRVRPGLDGPVELLGMAPEACQADARADDSSPPA